VLSVISRLPPRASRPTNRLGSERRRRVALWTSRVAPWRMTRDRDSSQPVLAAQDVGPAVPGQGLGQGGEIDPATEELQALAARDLPDAVAARLGRRPGDQVARGRAEQGHAEERHPGTGQPAAPATSRHPRAPPSGRAPEAGARPEHQDALASDAATGSALRDHVADKMLVVHEMCERLD
jgi:hypothetical protein